MENKFVFSWDFGRDDFGWEDLSYRFYKEEVERQLKLTAMLGRGFYVFVDSFSYLKELKKKNEDQS
jgi:hypothetical protein